MRASAILHILSVELIHRYRDSSLRIADLAAKCLTSTRTLSFICNRHFELPPSRLLRRYRLCALREEINRYPHRSLMVHLGDSGLPRNQRVISQFAETFGVSIQDFKSACLRGRQKGLPRFPSACSQMIDRLMVYSLQCECDSM